MSNDTAIAALSAIQKSLNVPKSKYNNFSGFYYRSLEDIVEAVKRLMPDGATLHLTDEIIYLGDRYYVKATVSFQYLGHSISASALAREPLDKKSFDIAQITGSCSSYARKYALNGLFAIDDTEDSDDKDNREEPKQAPKKTEEQSDRSKFIADSIVKLHLNDDKLTASEYIKKLDIDDKRKVFILLSPGTQEWIKSVASGAPK